MILIAISCAWVTGIILGAKYNLSLALIFTGLLPVPFIFLFRKYRYYLILLAICLATLFGAAVYYPFRVPGNSQLSYVYFPGEIELKGKIDTPPEVRDTITRVEFSVQEIKTSLTWQKIQGRVVLFVPRYPELKYGDILWIQGQLESPPAFNNFDYQAHLAHQGVYSTLVYPRIEFIGHDAASKPLEWIFNLREKLSHVLSAVLPEPQASLAQGTILGIRSTIPDALKTNLSVTGTAHLLAISGLNLSIIAGILVSIGLWIFGRRYYIYVWLALLMVWFYSLITGMQAPVIRSAIMASIFLFAELLGRQKNAIVALAFSAAVMVGINPQILWSISFQLSFLAIAGLIFITPPIQNLGRKAIHNTFGEEGFGVRTMTMVTDSFSISLGSIIAVWPVIAYYFGVISFVGPLATFLIAPVLAFIIFSGGITAIAGLISVPVAQIIGWVAWLFLSYMFWMVNAFASFPAASISVIRLNYWLVSIYYSIVGLAIWCKANFKRISRFKDNLKHGAIRTAGTISAVPKKWLISPLLVVAFLTCFSAATLPDNNLHVNILDVGEGDSILLQKGHQSILIDGGPSPQAVCLNLGHKMPFWDRNIDLVILTHPHLDHLSGIIEVIKRYKVGQVLAPNLISSSPPYREWLNLIKTQNTKYTLAQSGQQIKLDGGVILNVLNPPETAASEAESDIENNGIVIRLTFAEVSFLFTADVGQEVENRLINERAGLSCTVLKVAHHGSATSTISDFLSVAKPRIAVISVGANNSFGHPDKEVLERLKNTTVYRTDISGTIEFITDGRVLRVKTEK
jgi:competence protein ComEC